MKKLFLVSFLLYLSVNAHSQTDSIAKIKKNEIVLGLPLNLQSLYNRYWDRGFIQTLTSINLTYKRCLNTNIYLRAGINLLNIKTYIPKENNFYIAKDNPHLIYSDGYRRINWNESYLFTGIEKRFHYKKVTPFISGDFIIGVYDQKINFEMNELGDSLYAPVFNNSKDRTVLLYSDTNSFLYKSSYQSKEYGNVFGAIVKIGVIVNISKTIFTAIQTGGTIKWFLGNFSETYNNTKYNNYKNNTMNFDILQYQTNIMLGYRF